MEEPGEVAFLEAFFLVPPAVAEEEEEDEEAAGGAPRATRAVEVFAFLAGGRPDFGLGSEEEDAARGLFPVVLGPAGGERLCIVKQ